MNNLNQEQDDINLVKSSALENLVDSMPNTVSTILEHDYFITQIQYHDKNIVMVDFTKTMPKTVYDLQQESALLYAEMTQFDSYWVI